MKTFPIISLILLFAVVANAQFIQIPFGPPPTIDGLYNTGEWLATDSIFITQGSGKRTTILYQHDSLNIYFVFLGNLASSNIRFPEIMIDTHHDESAGWLNDDWWFHVSATDCEFQGAPNDYSNCAISRPNWTAAPNFTPSNGTVDTVEISIPFATLGIDILNVDTVGIAFDVSNTASIWEYWPAGASNGLPVSWGNAVFLSNSLTNDLALLENKISIYPNPVGETLKLDFHDAQPSNMSYEILNYLGKRIEAGIIEGGIIQMEGLKSGIYFLLLKRKGITHTRKFLKK